MKTYITLMALTLRNVTFSSGTEVSGSSSKGYLTEGLINIPLDGEFVENNPAIFQLKEEETNTVESSDSDAFKEKVNDFLNDLAQLVSKTFEVKITIDDKVDFNPDGSIGITPPQDHAYVEEKWEQLKPSFIEQDTRGCGVGTNITGDVLRKMETKLDIAIAEDRKEHIESLNIKNIGEALGAASMCWSETPKGIFDSTLASHIQTNLQQNLEKNGELVPEGTGAQLIAKERYEQLFKHDISVEMDAEQNANHQLLQAAINLLTANAEYYCPNGWHKEIWRLMCKKSKEDRIIIAGALLAAEYDRLNFITNKTKSVS